jgi:hypothetical protein
MRMGGLTMRNRLWLPAIVLPLLVALVLFAGLGAAPGLFSQSSLQASSAAGDPPSMGHHPLVDIPGLKNVPPDQTFSHFTSAQVHMTDSNGAAFVMNVIPGTVTAVNTTTSPQTVTITPNGQTTTETFNITSTTRVHGMPAPGTVEAVAKGDRVIVATQGSSMDAIAIAGWTPRSSTSMIDLVSP